MSLDRQRILNELGSVMNQLQSVDCGCMGKLFSDPQQGQANGSMSSPYSTCGGCRRGGCHANGYNHGAAYAGTSYPMNQGANTNMCMGQCNPPKLYADTYNYLNSNLMQPVVHEVYTDLKSISPNNTVGNSHLANQMGLQPNVGSPNANMEAVHGNLQPDNTMGNQPPGTMSNSPLGSMPIAESGRMNNLGGMGAQIVNMMMSQNNSKQNNQGKPTQLTDPMVIDAPQSPHGYVGITPLHGQGSNQAHNYQNVNHSNMNTHGQNSTEQYLNQHNAPGNLMNVTNQGNKLAGNENGNPAAQQMSLTNQRNYGQHTHGVMKFNEMFPGVMQGGDLGFDPMAIAIQMNPTNQQKAAMDAMQKVMNGNLKTGQMDVAKQAFGSLKPVGNATVPADGNIHNPNPIQEADRQITGQLLTNEQITDPRNIIGDQKLNQQKITPVQQNIHPNTEAYLAQTSAIPPQQQQVYTTLAGQHQNMEMYQQPADNTRQNIQQDYQHIIDPTVAGSQLGKEISNNPNSETIQPPQNQINPVHQMIKDPIYPANISRNCPLPYVKPQKRYDYNTLGQPVEMYPARMFHSPEPGLPQTLSPQDSTAKSRNDYTKYSNVKPTISKTSIFGNKATARASRSQLQHIYKQYKGSQSFTQQNVRVPPQGATISERKLNVPLANISPPQAPVERVGGDTTDNNEEISNQMVNAGQPIDQIGDGVSSNNHGDGGKVKMHTPPNPIRQTNLRNGLQDMVYTAYPSSAAWSFHGAHEYRSSPRGFNCR